MKGEEVMEWKTQRYEGSVGVDGRWVVSRSEAESRIEAAERERDAARAALDFHLRKIAEVREFAENLRGYGMDKDDNLALALLATLDGKGEK